MGDIWSLIPAGSMWRVVPGGTLAWPPLGIKGRTWVLDDDAIVLVRRFETTDNWVEAIVDGNTCRLHPSQFTTYNLQKELCRIDSVQSHD